MGRAPCCDKANVKKGPWSPEEDAKLRQFINEWGTGGNWITLPSKAGLKRCGKSCRLRWINYLKPDIKHGSFSEEEEKIIIEFHGRVGSRWSLIAAQLKGRTDNDIKNYWNTRLKKKLAQEGVNPSLYHQQQRACHMRSGGAAIWSLQQDSAGTIGQTQMANDFGSDIDLPAQYFDRHYSSDSSRYVPGFIPGQDPWFPHEQKLEALKAVKNEIPSISEADALKYVRNIDSLNEMLQQSSGWASNSSTLGLPQDIDLMPQQWLDDLPYGKLGGDLDDVTGQSLLPQHQPHANMRVPLFQKQTSATSTAFSSGRSCYGDYPGLSTFSDQASYRLEASNRMAPLDLVKSEHLFGMPELPPLESSESPISPESCSTSFRGWNSWGDSLAAASPMPHTGLRDQWD